MKKTLSLNKRQLESIVNLRYYIEVLKSDCNDEALEHCAYIVNEFFDSGAADELRNISEEALWGLMFAVVTVLEETESSIAKRYFENAHEQIGIAGENGVITAMVEAFE